MIHFLRAKRLHARTLNEQHAVSVEAHISDTNADLYLWFEDKDGKRIGFKFDAEQAAQLVDQIAFYSAPSWGEWFVTPERAIMGQPTYRQEVRK